MTTLEKRIASIRKQLSKLVAEKKKIDKAAYMRPYMAQKRKAEREAKAQ